MLLQIYFKECLRMATLETNWLGDNVSFNETYFEKYFTLSKWNIWNSVGILEQKMKVRHHQRQTGPNSDF